MEMYDFSAGFSPETRKKEKPRKDSFLDTVARGSRDWKEKAAVISLFRMEDAFVHFAEMCRLQPVGKQCLINIDKKNDIWLVNLILLDEHVQPIRTTTKEVYGRQIRTRQLDDAVVRFMNGASSRVISQPAAE